jgi:small-conductance mechanosensitive channel
MEAQFDLAFMNQFFVRALSAIAVAIALEACGLVFCKWLERSLSHTLSQRHGQNMHWYAIRRRRLLKPPQLLIRLSLALLAVFIALEIFDLPILPFAIWLLAVLFLFVLACRRLIENALACYIMMFEDIIGIGDKVRIGNCWATVEHIGWFATRLRDEEGFTHTIMNASLMQLVRSAGDEGGEKTRGD